MRWDTPIYVEGNRRRRLKFAWLPTVLGSEGDVRPTVWLERYVVWERCEKHPTFPNTQVVWVVKDTMTRAKEVERRLDGTDATSWVEGEKAEREQAEKVKASQYQAYLAQMQHQQRAYTSQVSGILGSPNFGGLQGLGQGYLQGGPSGSNLGP